MASKKSQFSINQISRVALLSALCVVLRWAFASFPNVQPITAIFLISSIALSLPEAILIMSTTMLVSSFLLGFGPWVLWQIFSFIIILCIWYYIFYPLTRIGSNQKKIYLMAQAAMAGFMGIIYGVAIDSCYAFLYSMPWWTYVLAGTGFNIAHAISTFLFYPLVLSIFRRLTHDKTF